MPYIGNNHIAGDHTNNFKVLDDISSFTATFDGSASSVVDTTNNTIRVVEHRFIQGQRVTYTNGGGGNIGGLTTGTAYFVIFDSASTIKLATNASNAASSTAINLSAVGTGSSHTLNAAFDGVNTKFKLTHGSGTGARLNNSTQINVAINNVVQRPNLDPNNFTDGFALEDNHKIVFQTAPTSEDIFWGSIIANTLTTFDISDHKIDTFTGDGSTTEFTLSHTPANNESLMVTINGVLQHPSNASTARAYTLIASIIQFTAAPANGDEIQVRHLGFAGATTADVSGFYGRTGNVALTANDHITTGDITARNINASGILTASSASFGGNVSIGGTLTYEDVTNIDSVGIVTARGGVHIPDDQAIRIGNTFANSDLRISSSPSNQQVVIDYTRSGTGRHLRFRCTDLLFENWNGLTRIARFQGGVGAGHAELYYAGNKKFETTAQGVEVTGHSELDNVSIVGVTTIADDKKLYLGNDQDLELYYQTSGVAGAYVETGNASGNLTIRNKDAGQYVYIHGDNIHLRSTTGNEPFLQAQHNGAVSLYYDYVKRIETTNQGINVIGHSELDNVSVSGVSTFSGNVSMGGAITSDVTFQTANGNNIFIDKSDNSIKLGNSVTQYFGGTSMWLMHNGSTGYLNNSTGDLYIRDNDGDIYIQAKAGEDSIKCLNDGGVYLYYDGGLVAETTTNGFQVTNGALDLVNNAGSGASLRCQSTGIFYVGNAAQGDLSIYCQDNTNNSIILQANTGEKYIECNMGGSVDLYHHGTKRFETTSYGVKTTGRIGIGTDTIRNNRTVQITGESQSNLLITGNAPGICLNADPDDTSDSDRTFFGLAAGNNNFANGTVAGDTIVRGTSSGKIIFGIGTAVKMHLTSAGDLNIGTVGRFDASGLVKSAAGTESAPSHTFLNDPDNGMYRPTTNTLGFVCGGTERARITSDGKLDVWGGYIGRNHADSFTLNGVTQPHYGLQLQASSTVPVAMSGYFGIAFATEGTERLRITRSGSFGFNNNNPQYTIDIVGNQINLQSNATDSNAVVRLRGQNSSRGGAIVAMNSSGAAGPLEFWSGSNQSLRIEASGNKIKLPSVKASAVHAVSTADVEIAGRHYWKRITSQYHVTTATNVNHFYLAFFRNNNGNQNTCYFRGVVVNVIAGGNYDWSGHGYVTHSSQTILSFHSTTGGVSNTVYNQGHNSIHNNSTNMRVQGVGFSYDSNYLYTNFRFHTNLSGTGFKPHYNVEVIDPSQCTYTCVAF